MSLEEKSLKELTEHYNSLPNVKAIKLFKDKPTAIKRIQALESTKKEQNWIAFISQTEKDYRVNIRHNILCKYGRPKDMNGLAMVALRPKVEESLKTQGI